MGNALSVFDAIIAAGMVVVAVAGAYWALVVRLTKTDASVEKEKSERESDIKGLGSDIERLQDDVAKVAHVTDKLRRRDDFRRGKESAEDSDVRALPRRRPHAGSDTFTK